MNLEEQMREWHQAKTLLRLVMVDKRLGQSIHVGNLIYVDDKVRNIMFYDVDQKKNYNFSTSEIEEIYPFDSKQAKEANQAKQDKRGKESKSTLVDSNPRLARGRNLQIDIRKNCMETIQKLTDEDLMAVMPIIQHLAQKNSGKH